MQAMLSAILLCLNAVPLLLLLPVMALTTARCTDYRTSYPVTISVYTEHQCERRQPCAHSSSHLPFYLWVFKYEVLIIIVSVSFT
mmetsp:Transcript_3901/g.5934  ORF Transcript_3901/g.5934 Transcript_3901/m.5934 type:complete len:85 (+) Transcript_3901:410-664(+)